MHVGSFSPALPEIWQLRPWEPALIRPSRACPRHRLVCCQTRRGREPNCPPCAQPERGLATHLLAACLSSSLILSSCTAAHANNVKSRPQYLEAPPAAQTSGATMACRMHAREGPGWDGHEKCLGAGGVEKQQPSVREQVAAVEDLTRKARAAAEDGHFDKVQESPTHLLIHTFRCAIARVAMTRSIMHMHRPCSIIRRLPGASQAWPSQSAHA